jgi:hypothetical protein
MGTKFAELEAEIVRSRIDPDVLGPVSVRALPDRLAFGGLREEIHGRLMKIVSQEFVERVRYAVVKNGFSLEGIMRADPNVFPDRTEFALASEEERDGIILHASRILCAASGKSMTYNNVYLYDYFLPEAARERSVTQTESSDDATIVEEYLEECLFHAYRYELFKVLRT